MGLNKTKSNKTDKYTHIHIFFSNKNSLSDVEEIDYKNSSTTVEVSATTAEVLNSWEYDKRLMK